MASPSPESPKVPVDVEGRRLLLSSLDKVMYPETGTTKAEVLDYYARVAPVLLPHLAGRPVTRIRYPHGVADPMQFFEKNIPSGTPDWVRRAGRDPVFPLVDDLAGLTWLVNLNSLELHVPQWRYEGEGRDAVALNPDRLVIDLDPGPGMGLGDCATVALIVRDRLGAIGLDTLPVTSGSKGMQLYAVLPGDHTSDQIRDTVQQLAQELSKAHPELIVWKMAKDLRPGRIFLDWSQNVAAKTTICPYSLRGRSRPTVAAPRSWAEVEAGAESAGGMRGTEGTGELVQLEMGEVLARVARDGDLAAAITA
jgi:bifunctional non-homologous end joining protein LigD